MDNNKDEIKDLAYRYKEDSFDLEKTKSNFISELRKKLRHKKNKKVVLVLNIFTFALIVLLLSQIYFLSIYYYDIYNNKQQAKLSRENYENFITTIPTENKVAEETVTELPMKTENQVFIESLQGAFNNDEIIGYIKIEDTAIDYPIVQHSDNTFYLDKDNSKMKNVAGSIFLDYENNPLFTDRNSIIYGHNMRAKIMFHDLRYYSQKEYYDNHKYINIKTEKENTTWEIFSAFSVDIRDLDYIKTVFPSNEKFNEFKQELKELSLYDTGVTISDEDIVLGLSTCTNTDDYKRYVVYAKLVEREGSNKTNIEN